MTIIEQIKAEVEKRIELHDSLASNAESEMIANLEIGAAQALDDLRSFLSTLESEKPLGLEKEIERKYANDTTTLRTRSQYAELARYFYDLGCRRTAEKYDEIEYNRQRAEEQGSEELERELRKEIAYFAINGGSGDDTPTIGEIARHFAKWGAEHSKK